jgi:hypothetical protein
MKAQTTNQSNGRDISGLDEGLHVEPWVMQLKPTQRSFGGFSHQAKPPELGPEVKGKLSYR